MKRAIILYGPSGVGKTTIATHLSTRHGFKHADIDTFMLLFSRQRSKERSEIAQKLCYTYACELVKHNYDVIIEALAPRYLTLLQKQFRSKNYRVDEISLDASLEVCILRDSQKKERELGAHVVKEVYEKYRSTKGYCFNASNKQPKQLLREIEDTLKL